MGMIRGFWNSVQVICGNHCNEQIEMTVQEGPSSLFYACPKYHPENRTEGSGRVLTGSVWRSMKTCCPCCPTC